jgi:predicted RND superfamily exporter protein
MFAHIGERNMQSMLTSLPMALLLISILLVFALRSVRLGAISLLPNILPAVAGFGIWGLYSGEINLGVLAISDFRLNADLGQSTGLVISIALLVDFFLLPAFLVLFDKSKTVEKTDENLLRNAA